MLAKHQPWVNPESSVDIQIDVEWNMWKPKQWPFDDVEQGDHIVYVSGGGPTSGRLMWEVVVRDLVKAHYRSHQHAWQLLSRSLPAEVLEEQGVSETAFLNHRYTQEAAPEGWLLAWWGDPVRLIDVPRPDGFQVHGNGWGELPDGTHPGWRQLGVSGLSDAASRHELIKVSSGRVFTMEVGQSGGWPAVTLSPRWVVQQFTFEHLPTDLQVGDLLLPRTHEAADADNQPTAFAPVRVVAIDPTQGRVRGLCDAALSKDFTEDLWSDDEWKALDTDGRLDPALAAEGLLAGWGLDQCCPRCGHVARLVISGQPEGLNLVNDDFEWTDRPESEDETEVRHCPHCDQTWSIDSQCRIVQEATKR